MLQYEFHNEESQSRQLASTDTFTLKLDRIFLFIVVFSGVDWKVVGAPERELYVDLFQKNLEVEEAYFVSSAS